MSVPLREWWFRGTRASCSGEEASTSARVALRDEDEGEGEGVPAIAETAQTLPRKDAHDALRTAACRSKGSASPGGGSGGQLHFLRALLRHARDLIAEESPERLRWVLRLIDILPEAEQGLALGILHEESAGKDRDGGGAFLSAFHDNVEDRARIALESSLEDRPTHPISVADLLGAADGRQAEMEESARNLLALYVDILLTRHGEKSDASAIQALETMAARHAEAQKSSAWCRSVVEILLNARMRNRSADSMTVAEEDEVCSLLLTHQHMSLAEPTLGTGACHIRVETLVKSLEIFNRSGRAEERGLETTFAKARNHVLSIALIKLRTVFPSPLSQEGLSPPLFRLGSLHMHMQAMLKEVLRTCFEYWRMPSSVLAHCKSVLAHYRHFDEVCGRRILSPGLTASSDDAITLVPPELDGRRMGLPQGQSQDLEDKVVILCLLHLCLRYLKHCGDSRGRLGQALRSALGQEKLKELCKTPTLLWQTNQGRNLWLASTRYFESKPSSSLAAALGVLLHFELTGKSNTVLIKSIAAPLQELEVFVREECAESSQQSGKINGGTVYGIIHQCLLASSLAAAANLPACVGPTFSCIFEYAGKDVDLIKDAMPTLGINASTDAFEKHSKTFLALVQRVYRPLFELKVRLGRMGKIPQDSHDETFFRCLFSIVRLLLVAVDGPIKTVLGATSAPQTTVGLEANIQMLFGMAEGCLDILQIFLQESGPDLTLCGDKLTSKIEKASMAFDYILAKLIHVMKAYKMGKRDLASEIGSLGCSENGDQSSFRKEEGMADGGGDRDVYGSVKVFVTKCIETFSIQRVRKRQADSGSKAKAETSKEKKKALGTAKGHGAKARGKSKRLKRSTNAFIDAALREEGYHAKEDGDLSDLEDFIVCKPGRDYDRVLAKRSPGAQGPVRVGMGARADGGSAVWPPPSAAKEGEEVDGDESEEESYSEDEDDPIEESE